MRTPSISYDAALVEEAVFRSVPRLAGADQRVFHREREPIYGVGDLEQREAAFRRLFGRWFKRLRLGRPIEQALAELPQLGRAIAVCHVVPATTGRDEQADLRARPALLADAPDDRASTAEAPTLMIRIQTASLLDTSHVRGLLRHELRHAADMIDPSFGYERELPASFSGTAHDPLLRARYHVIWDATVDGRLFHAGRVHRDVRALRLRAFRSTFPTLGAHAENEFARWFNHPRPTHREILAFAVNPQPPR